MDFILKIFTFVIDKKQNMKKEFNGLEFNELCAKLVGGIYSEIANAWGGFGNARYEQSELSNQCYKE